MQLRHAPTPRRPIRVPIIQRLSNRRSKGHGGALEAAGVAPAEEEEEEGEEDGEGEEGAEGDAGEGAGVVAQPAHTFDKVS